MEEILSKLQVLKEEIDDGITYDPRDISDELDEIITHVGSLSND